MSRIQVAKTGQGEAILSSLQAAEIAVLEGRLAVAAGTSPGFIKSDKLYIDSNNGADLDLQNNRLILDYDASEGSPLRLVAEWLQSGENGGSWDGPGIIGTVNNGQQALGYAEISELGSPSTFLGESVDSTTIVIRLALRGDTDLDGDVDFDDLLKLGQNYQNLSEQMWTDGDFDYDGDVDFDDLLKLTQNYNTSLLDESLVNQLLAAGGSDFIFDIARIQGVIPEPAVVAPFVRLVFFGSGRKRNRNPSLAATN